MVVWRAVGGWVCVRVGVGRWSWLWLWGVQWVGGYGFVCVCVHAYMRDFKIEWISPALFIAVCIIILCV